MLRPQDYAPSGYWLVLGMPELRGFGVAFSGLVGAGLIAIALVLAAAGAHACATALGHDAFYRAHDTAALTSRRLAMTRLSAIVAIVLAAFLTSAHILDPRPLIGLAIVFSVSAVLPLIVLSLWARATGTDAAVALLVGLATAGVAIALGGAGVPTIERLSVAAVTAACASVLAGVAMSFTHRTGLASQGSAFVHGVLYGASDVLHSDRGA